MSKKRILFVDDEANVLDGLKRMLRHRRKDWDMRFAESAEQALKLMQKEEMDVLVSDMRMPGMNGAELLTRVRDDFPRTTRIMLSGHSDLELIVKSVLPAHQYVTKPCDSNCLISILERALTSQGIMTDPTLQKVISSLESLPVLPVLYHEIMKELNEKEPSLPRVAKIISKDVGMAAEILKIVNSSFFGFARRIASLEQAVTLLGINIMRSLVLGVHIFSKYESSSLPGYGLENLWQHSLRTSSIARILCIAEKKDKDMQGEAVIGGLLHDVGKIIFASNLTNRYGEVLNVVKQENRSVCEVELEMLGTTHAEVGAYLMGLWGLPSIIVEAMVSHHTPNGSIRQFTPISAVYAANVLDHQHWIIHPEYARHELNEEYLKQIGCLDRISVWHQEVQNFANEVSDAGA